MAELLGFFCQTFTEGFSVCLPMPDKGLAASLTLDRVDMVLDKVLQLFRLMVASGMVKVLCRPLRYGEHVHLPGGVVQMLSQLYGCELPFDPYTAHPLRGVLVSVQELCLILLKQPDSKQILVHGERGLWVAAWYSCKHSNSVLCNPPSPFPPSPSYVGDFAKQYVAGLRHSFRDIKVAITNETVNLHHLSTYPREVEVSSHLALRDSTSPSTSASAAQVRMAIWNVLMQESSDAQMNISTSIKHSGLIEVRDRRVWVVQIYTTLLIIF
jgi:hypothetical protein